MELWLQLINAETEEELSMLENTNVKEINNAIFILRKLNADENMRYLAEMREKALHDEVSAINSAEKDGIGKGRKEGKAKGRIAREAEIIASMRRSGMTEEQIKKILNS